MAQDGTEDFILTLTHATERDVDLIVVEELQSAAPFVQWMVGKVGWAGAPNAWRVLHSKRRIRNRREIDIHVELDAGAWGQRSVLLIENKITESEQPEQGESYRAEAMALMSDGIRAATILTCPEAYARANSGFGRKFDAVVTFEEMSSFLRIRATSVDAETARRLLFRADLLDQASGKLRRGWQAVPNQVIGSFNAQYVELLVRIALTIKPGASMLKDAPPDESVSMIYDHNASLDFLPQAIRPRRFAHEFGRNSETRANYVAVTFPGWGAVWPEIQQMIEGDTRDSGFLFGAATPTPKRPRPGLVMALATPPIDNQASFESQSEKLRQGIEAAMRLREWLKANRSVIESWGREVEKILQKQGGTSR